MGPFYKLCLMSNVVSSCVQCRILPNLHFHPRAKGKQGHFYTATCEAQGTQGGSLSTDRRNWSWDRADSQTEGCLNLAEILQVKRGMRRSCLDQRSEACKVAKWQAAAAITHNVR